MGIADAGTAMALDSATPATILIARVFMERLLVLLHLHWRSHNRFRGGCRPATESAVRSYTNVSGENNFSTLALTAPTLRRSQFYEPCEAAALDAHAIAVTGMQNFSVDAGIIDASRDVSAKFAWRLSGNLAKGQSEGTVEGVA